MLTKWIPFGINLDGKKGEAMLAMLFGPLGTSYAKLVAAHLTPGNPWVGYVLGAYYIALIAFVRSHCKTQSV